MADNNPFPGENNTGHIWDDNLRELSNPPPRWWMIAFWASIIWFFGYGVLYPMYPIGNESTKGVMGWTQIGEYNEGVDEVEAVRAEFESQLKGMSAKDVLADPGLSEYTVAAAKVLFGDNCAACHGGGGQGGPNFPVLADDDWLYGGAIETIEQTISMGRKGIMTAHGKIISDDELGKLVTAIEAGNPAGEPLFMQKGCIACHGMDGKGMQVLGSANLTDGIYRFTPEEGQSRSESIAYTIKHGVNDATDPASRVAEMPSFGDRLSKDDIKKLAVYVYKFGGGQ
ncbi:cytochrome-c oxidase, cbb3-type subunit III [Candidatus Endoriftia persephone]|jgi:cytochrome c oxidase cbb3-type subunit 3|uniref:Cbb3-type cytochrome c oxidase subunit n=3 Tax=Gammaproteobacteria TaxID=1236 RepID=G2FHF6_9GAMM|nr:cytochrome-c oxidase, cbb3-type subunit III [Candidatus Endoriftia persephone]EGW53830.1 cytochrome c oxidase subunit CcoP [endosymbiont of Tevnia jerichonana (vent Tica)]USF88539.1 cytochrome-c oxidase, cbb3-type subunit III [Candidatus Endoriftia persephone]